MRRFVLAVCYLTLFADAASAGQFKPAPKDGVPAEYIVVLEDGVAQRGRHPDRLDQPESEPAKPRVSEIAEELRRLYGGELLRTWEHVLQGYLVRMPEPAARALAGDPKVKSVRQNTFLSAPIADCYDTTRTDESDQRSFPSSPQKITCGDPDPQNLSATCKDNWGLDRIDQTVGRDSWFHFGPAGPNTTHVFIIDSGIRTTHSEFKDANGNSRIGTGYNAITPGGSLEDDHGHGTHVAGIVGGKTFGVAKHAILRPVKIFSANVRITGDATIDGLNWIASVYKPAGSIATMSINAGDMRTNTDLHTAVRNLFGWGVQLIQSAGNVNKDACNWSLGAAVPETIVVAGSDENDQRWRRRAGDPLYRTGCENPENPYNRDCSSNYGSCIDLWAPAAHIVSASKEGDNSYCRLSGTSLAAPHAAGVAALYLEKNSTASTQRVRNRLRNYALAGVLDTNPSSEGYIKDGSADLLLSMNSVTSWIDASACFSATCNKSTRSCTFSASCSRVDPDTYIYKRWWNFGDGDSGYGADTVTHTFPANATYTVTLGLLIMSGEYPSATKCVNFTSSPVPGCI